MMATARVVHPLSITQLEVYKIALEGSELPINPDVISIDLSRYLFHRFTCRKLHLELVLACIIQ